MIQKIKTLLLSLSMVFMFSAPLAIPATVSADVTPTDINNNLCSGANGDLSGAATDCANTPDPGNFNGKIKTIINIISVIIGIVAVIMIIFGGFRYITSGGAADKVTGAKNTILYAIIGLIIVALAQVIVKFVLNKTSAP